MARSCWLRLCCATACGPLTTIDIHPDSGYLISGPYANVADRIVGDSIAALGDVRGVDIFLHDSLHTVEHEAAELAAVGPRLTPNALVLSAMPTPLTR